MDNPSSSRESRKKADKGVLSFEISPLVFLVWRDVVVPHFLLPRSDVVRVARLLATRPRSALLGIAVADDFDSVADLPASLWVRMEHAENHVARAWCMQSEFRGSLCECRHRAPQQNSALLAGSVFQELVPVALEDCVVVVIC